MSRKMVSQAEKSELIAAYQSYLDERMEKAHQALAVLRKYSQNQVDALVEACARAVYDHAEELARDAVDETKLGVYEDKVAKNKNKAKIIWQSLKDKKSVGIIEREEGTGIVKVASPVGVVGAVTPVTNPIVTVMSNAMFAIKGRNPIIFAVHPKAMACCRKTVQYVNEAFAKLDAPDNVIQILDISALPLTQMLSQTVDVVIATGGMDMVRSVYSSGKPALGVGAGNVQALVDRNTNLSESIPKIITGRAFDNGIICAAEQSVILPREDFDRAMAIFAENRAYIVAESERDALRAVIFPEGHMSRDLVGQNAQAVADAAGIAIPGGTRILVVQAKDLQDVLGWEKMFPVLTSYKYDTWEEAVEIARDNLRKIGIGHSIAVHSNDAAHVEYAGVHTEVSRVVVNQVCASSAGGSFQNGLNPTNTLGCGSWGNNSISENLTYSHLINVSRIAYHMKDNPIPTDAEIWS